MNEREIFIEALQQPDDQRRSAFLNEACGHDTALRARVDALLNQELHSFLDEPAFELNELPRSSDVEQDVGTSIGPYKLREQIGEGGFGLVFVAEQREPVRRRVALKLIKPGMDSKEIIARFEAERQALALMDHPNIARVLDAGTTESGRPYFVMDLVRGIPITTFCDENQLSPRERLTLFLPICRAVQHAHQKGIIHRDIKPSNLLVTINDGESVPKVIDFGVAKALNQRLTEQTVHTRFTQMIGTPLYMSPEQAEMSSVDVDTRSDIYSLGVLLYELLTGSTPFDRKQLSEAALDEVRRIIREEEPAKPSTRLSQSGERLRGLAAQRKTEPAKLSKMIRGDLDWIVMKALEKDRNRRYETANGLAADIERHLRDEEVVARPPSAVYRLRKFARRNKTVFTTVAIIAAALLVATIVSTSQWIRARNAKLELGGRLYASQMNQASEALGRGDIHRMKQLLSAQIPDATESDLRGFEWRLLWRAGHLSKNSTANVATRFPFLRLAVSPDGKMIAATDLGNATIQVFDGENLNPLCSPLKIGTPLDQLCFSHDGHYLMAADWSGALVRVFDTKTWAHIRTLSDTHGHAVACARDKSLMVVGGSRKQITLWDTESWAVVHSLPTENGMSHHLALSPDGKRLANVVVTDGRIGPDRIELWDLRDLPKPKRLHPLPGKYLTDHEIEFSPDGKLFAAGDRDGTIRIWSVAELFADGGEPNPLRTLKASNSIRAISFSPDSTRLAIANSLISAVFVPDAVQVFDLASEDAQPIATFEDHSKKVTDISFVGDANTICTVAFDATLKMWDLDESRAYDVIPGVDLRSSLGYGPDGSLIYQDFATGKIRSWDTTQRKPRTILDVENSYSRIDLSANGNFLAAVTHDEQRLRVWNLADKREVHSSSLTLEDLRRRIESEGGVSSPRGNDRDARDSDRAFISRLSVSNDGRLVACVVRLRTDSDRALVVVIDPDDGRPVAQARLHVGAPLWPVFSPSGRQLVTMEYYGSISFLSDVNSASLLPRLQIPALGVATSAAFSPDGHILAIGNFSNEIRLHNVADGALIQSLNEHAQWPNSVAFSPDGHYLTSAAPDGRVLIWKQGRNEEFQLVSTLRGLPDLDTLYAAIGPGNESLAVLHGDLNWLTSGSSEGKIQVWRVARREEVSRNFNEQLRRGDAPAQSLEQLTDILTRDSEFLLVRRARGRLHDRLGNWQAAAADWTRALEQVPGNFHLLEMRARAYELGKRWSEAEGDWSRLVRLTQESNGEYLLGRGECYLRMGRLDDARTDFAEALTRTASVDTIQRIVSLMSLAESLVPIGCSWQYQMGTAPPRDWKSPSFDDSRWQTGWAPFGGTQRYLPTRTDTSFHDVWLRRTFVLDHDIDSSLVLRMRVEGDVEVFVNGASVMPAGSFPNYLDDYPSGWVHWHKYLRIYPIVPCSGEPRLREGKNVLAVRCRNPKSARSYVDVGLYASSDDVDMESMISEVTGRVPGNTYLHTALALRFVEQQKWREAAAQFHQSARLGYETGLPKWMWAALMYRQSGDLNRYHELAAELIERDTNAEIMEQFKDEDPAERVGRLAKACLLAKPSAENLPGLIEMADRALKLNPNNPSAQVARALAAYWSDDFEDAIEWAQKCGDDNRQAKCVLALANADAGKVESARIETAQLLAATEEHHFQVSFKRKDGAHEAAFFYILLEEVKRKLNAE